MKGGSEIYGKKTSKAVRKDKCRKRRKNRKKYNLYKIDDRPICCAMPCPAKYSFTVN